MKIEEGGIISIPFEITNVGAGIAFSIHIKLLEYTENPEELFGIATAVQRNGRGNYDILGVREPIYTDILRIEKQTELCLYLSAANESFGEAIPTLAIRWKFEIR